tara:strand:- start:162 stop:422 length:261 start_codon:yes stop_codon:yes gene_type:complete
MNKEIKFRTRQTWKGIIVPEKVWITFLNNGFQKEWIPLTDWQGNQLFWSDELIDQIKKIAGEKFGVSFGLSPCSQKKLGNACIDNF